MTKLDRLIDLKYEVLKCKYLYYCRPDLETITDQAYDIIEQAYRSLYEETNATNLQEENVADMVGFDLNFRSARFVKMSVDVNALSKRDYEAKKAISLHKYDYDISIFRDE